MILHRFAEDGFMACPGRGQGVDFYHRGVAYCFEYIVVNNGHTGVLGDLMFRRIIDLFAARLIF